MVLINQLISILEIPPQKSILEIINQLIIGSWVLKVLVPKGKKSIFFFDMGGLTLASASKICIRPFLLVYSTTDEQRAYIK
jgi:hypothetical protein